MATATITLTDDGDGVNITLEFADGPDQESDAHSMAVLAVDHLKKITQDDPLEDDDDE